MRLFNKTIDRQLFKQYSLGSDLSKQEVVAKIFNPVGNGTWFILNSDPQDPDYLWAIVDLGYGAEVGSVSRSDLETYRGRFGMGFERDLSFDPVNALELYNGLRQGKYYADGGDIQENKHNIFFFYNENGDEQTFLTLEEATKEAKKQGQQKVRDNLGGEYFINYADGGQIEVVYERRADFKKKPVKLLLLSRGREQKGYTFSGKDQVAILDNYNRNKQEDLEKLWNLKGYETKYADGGEISSKLQVLFEKMKNSLSSKNFNYFDKLSNEVHEISDTKGLTEKEYEAWDSLREKQNELRMTAFLGKSKFADGGELVDYSDNQLMVMNQNVEVEHHHEELEDILKEKTPVPAWVVAKMETATQNLSDITHYLDGQKELMEDEDEEEDEDQDEIENKEVVEPINVSAGTKAELTKKFTDDAMGNLRGFLKGMEGIDLRDDYTFDYKDEQYEVEPIINSDENGVSNAVFTIFDGDGEEVGDVSYSRDGGKQKFTANSEFFSWNNAKFEDGGYFDGTIPKVSTYMSTYAKGGKLNNYDRNTVREDMENFSKIAKLSKDGNDFIERARKIKNISPVTSQWFFERYDSMSMKQASDNFVKDVKSGNFDIDEIYAKGGSMNKHFWSWKYAPNDNSFKSVIIYKTDIDDENSYDSVEQIKEQLTKEGVNKFIEEDLKHFWSWKYAPNDNSFKSVIIYKTDIDDENSYDSVKQIKEQLVKEGVTKFIEEDEENYAKGGEVAKAEIIGLSKNIMGTTSIEMKISGMRKSQDFSVYPIAKDDTDKIITIQSETRIGKIDLATGRGLMSQSHSNGAYFVHFQMDKLTPFTINEKDLKDLTSHIYRTAGDNVGSRGIFSDNSGASGVYADGGFMADVYADGGLINAKTFDFLKKHKGFRYTIEEKPNGRISLEIQEDGSKSYAEIYNSTDDKNVFYINSVSGNIGDDIQIGKRWYGDTPYNLNGIKLWLKERGYIKEKINVIKNYPTTYNEYISLLTDYEPLQQFAEFIGYTYPNYYFDNDNRIYTNYMLPQYKYFNVKGYLEPLFWNNFFQKLFKTKDLRLTLTLFGTQIGTKDTGNYGSKQGFINSGEKYLLDIFYMNEISPLLDIKNWHRINEKNIEIDSKFIKKIEIRSKNNFKMILDYIVSELKNNKEFQNYLKTKDSESVKGKGLKSGDSIVESFDKYVKVKTKENETVYVVLTTGERTFNLPTKFADGGFMSDVYADGGGLYKLLEYALLEDNGNEEYIDNLPKYPEVLTVAFNKNGGHKIYKVYETTLNNGKFVKYPTYRIGRDMKPYSKLKYVLKALDKKVYDENFENDNYAKGGMVVTSIKDIPNFKERLEQRKITYRGLGMGKLYDDFYDLAGTSGTRIKVDGKEYFITDEEFNTFSRGADGKMQIRFDAPARKGYADGGSVKSETKVGETYIRKDMRGNWKAETNIDNFNDYDWRLSTIKTYSGKLITSAQGGKTEPTGSKGYEIFKYTPYEDPNYTLEVSSPKRLTDKVVSEQHVKGLAKFKKFMETGMFRGGGKISKFDKLSDKVAKEYEGKPVKSQYQEEYGKYYSKAEAQEVGDKVAGKVKAMQMTKK